MSLPIHLQSIKSSGVYRFVYDKSVISGQTAETLRLVVGYSDKGPFNTPVYITSRDEFIKTYGNISKRLEKKGVFFHRLALQALTSGPILAFNLKPFDNTNKLQSVAFNAPGIYGVADAASSQTPTLKDVTEVYDTNRFWTVKAEDFVDTTSYIVLSTTDTKDTDCTILMRKAEPAEYKLSIREYYAGVMDEMPEYLAPIADMELADYFMDVYVFKGKFTKDLCSGDGPLAPYFNVVGDNICLKEDGEYLDAFGNPADALVALANDSASNYIAGYRGTTIPYFKNANGTYISIDIAFNSGYESHKMLMNMDELKLYSAVETAATPAAAITALNNLIRVPYIDETNSDMHDDGTPIYYKKNSAAGYAYVKLSNPTAEETTAGDSHQVTSLPTAQQGAEPIVKLTQGTEQTPAGYYKLESDVITYSYSTLATPTAAQKRAAEKNMYDTVPTEVTAASPEYICVMTVGSANIKPIMLTGFTYTPAADLVKASLDVLTGAYGKGLQEALTNRIDVEYHYLVDTFDTKITNDKTPLAALVKKKDNAFAILNFPKIKDYINAENHPYVTPGTHTLDFDKVVKVFNLPDDADGASWCGYFTQVVVTDGTVKTTIPSAGLVSNLFMDKWTSRQPYYIVAGSQYGRLLDGTLVGPDYAFSKTDRDALEPFGINVIVYEPRRGTYINSEQTAKQIPVSALSKIHIRELVIYLQDEIAELLESYRWELNTQVLRDKIKAKADVILETVKNNGGVYDYLNVCDDSNNTSETIDNEFLVLDTHIEPARGSGKMIEQLYIYRTGEMRSVLLQG